MKIEWEAGRYSSVSEKGQDVRSASSKEKQAKRPASGNDKPVKFPSTARFLPGVPAGPGLESASYAAEEYRKLAVQVREALPPGDSGHVVTVTSPDPNVGKTLTSLNLAMALTRSGECRVLLLEGDIWRPSLLAYLTVSQGLRGLPEILSDGSPSVKEATTLEGTSLDVIITRTASREVDLVTSRRMAQLIEQARAQYEFVVIDSPPMTLASGRALSLLAHGVIVVIGAGRTKKKAVEETLATLGPQRTLGFVLNGVRPDKGLHYAYPVYPPSRRDRLGAWMRSDSRTDDDQAFDVHPAPRRRWRSLLKGLVFLVVIGAGLLLYLTFGKSIGLPGFGRHEHPVGSNELKPVKPRLHGEGAAKSAIEPPVQPPGVSLDAEGLNAAVDPSSAGPFDEVYAPTRAGSTMVRLNLRSSPGLDGPLIETLGEGETIDVRARKGAWFYVNTKGRWTWVHQSGVKLDPPESAPGEGLNSE